MKILHLTLKKKWFDMIASGEKKEEYREIKWHWISRLTTIKNFPPCVRPDVEADLKYFDVNRTLKIANAKISKFDLAVFKNGYGKCAPSVTVRLEDILIGVSFKDIWGAPQGRVFIIKLGEILERSPF